MTMRITAVTIEPAQNAIRSGHTEPRAVRATFTDGTTRDLFTYYSDELHFTEAEFVGLTNKVPARVSNGRARLLGASVPALPSPPATIARVSAALA